MTDSIMDSILGMVTPDMKQALATRLGESLEGVQSGLGAATAATLSGLDRRLSLDPAFLGRVLGLLEDGGGLTVVGSLPTLAAGGFAGAPAELTRRFERHTFRTQREQVAGAISQHAGLNVRSGRSLLSMAAALVLAYLARVHSVTSLNASSVGDMLREDAPNLHGYLPASLLPGAVTYIARRARFSFPPPQWLVPLAVAGTLLLTWLVIRSLERPVADALASPSESASKG